MDLNSILSTLAALIPSVKQAALAVGPYAFWAAVACVVAIDLIDVDLFKREHKRLPGLSELWQIVKSDVADQAIGTVAVAAGLAYFAATGDKFGAAKAIFVAGVIGSLAVEEQYLKAKLLTFLKKSPPVA